MEPARGPVVLRARPIFFFFYFSISFVTYLLVLTCYVLNPNPPIPVGVFSNWALGISILFFLFLCFSFKPHVVADNEGVCFNTRLRKKRFSWQRIRQVEWRSVEHGVPGAALSGATYVVRVNPVLKDHEGKDLVVIDYAVWGRNEAEQAKFIEFVGQQIKATA
jgi:hypothetical protein